MAKRAKQEPAPDDVVRQTAGSYTSGDGRFEVRQSDANWYVVDTAQANEFGQELMHGPFGSLKEAKASIPGAREVKPLLRSTPRPVRPAAKPSRPAPETWIDKLPDAERRQVRALIRALERDGLEGAEELVRRHRDDTAPTIATRLLEQRLEALVNDLPEKEREAGRDLVRRVVEMVASGGNTHQPAPGWALVEVGPNGERAPRRMSPRI